MASMTEAGGVIREHKACETCGKPRSTLLVPDSLTYTNKKGESVPVGTLTVTICMVCDGGIEWVTK